MDLYLSKKYDLNAHREIAQRNLDAFKYKHAKLALAGNDDSSAYFMVARDGDIDFAHPDLPEGLDCLADIWKRVLLEGPSTKPGEEIEYTIDGFVNTFTIKPNEEYHEHLKNMQDFIESYEKSSPGALSKEAQEMLADRPEMENEYILQPSVSLPPEDKELFDTYSLYWRKANHIHNWFVENVHHGDDNQEDFSVSKEDLIALKETLEKATEIYNKATFSSTGAFLDPSVPEKLEELLPTRGGFFFGDTSYSGSYHSYNESTLKDIKTILAEVDFDKYMFVYSASW